MATRQSYALQSFAKAWWVLLLWGLAFLIAGLCLLFWPVRTASDAVGYQWSWGNFFLGVLVILLGIFLLFRPLLGIFTLLWLTAILAIIGGVLLIVESFRVKGLADVA